MKNKTVGLLIPDQAAFRLCNTLHQLRDLTLKNSVLHDLAGQCLDALNEGEAGAFTEVEIGPEMTASGVRSDFAIYAANLARHQAILLAQGRHAEARANAAEGGI